MRIVVKNVGEIPKVVEVENTLETYQNIVGGYIETYPFVEGMLIIFNEEGKLMGLKPNMVINGETIVGNIAIVSHGEEDFEGLSEEQLDFFRNSFMLD